MKQIFSELINIKLAKLFKDMAADGVSPGRCLRLEGFIQAGVELGYLSRDEAVYLICQCFEAQFLEPLNTASVLLGDALADELDIRIPIRMPLAKAADNRPV